MLPKKGTLLLLFIFEVLSTSINSIYREGDKSAEDAAKEDEKKELTLEEYKAQLQQKLTPKTTFNVRSPEGEHNYYFLVYIIEIFRL